MRKKLCGVEIVFDVPNVGCFYANCDAPKGHDDKHSGQMDQKGKTMVKCGSCGNTEKKEVFPRVIW